MGCFWKFNAVFEEELKKLQTQYLCEFTASTKKKRCNWILLVGMSTGHSDPLRPEQTFDKCLF